MTKETKKETIHVTPCCKSRHWHSVNRVDLPDGIVRCELCGKMMDIELLEIVIKGLNPTTFFCDKCHISAEQAFKQTQA